MDPIIEKIISGGQTGADIGGLVAAEKLGIPTGGTAPKDWKTEAGPQPMLGYRFGLVESTSKSYPPRTRENIRAADLTLIFCRPPLKGGSKTTAEMADKLGKPWFAVDPWDEQAVEHIREVVRRHKPRVINVAERRESKEPGIASQVKMTLLRILPDISLTSRKENAMPIEFDPAHAIKIAADSLETLRRPDVYRLYCTYDPEHHDALSEYIKNGRADLADEVDEVLADLNESGTAPR